MMIVFSSFNDTNLSHSVLSDCCMLKSQEQEWDFHYEPEYGGYLNISVIVYV
jgi:hypothetical protein